MVGIVAAGGTGESHWQCVCGNDAEEHHRDHLGVEICTASCVCRGYVPAVNAPPCLCGHSYLSHVFMVGPSYSGGRCRLCRSNSKCDSFRTVPVISLDQFRDIWSGSQTVIVIIDASNSEPLQSSEYETMEQIAGNINAAADVVFVNRGNGLYFVARHPNRDVVGGYFVTPDNFRQTLMRMREKLSCP